MKPLQITATSIKVGDAILFGIEHCLVVGVHTVPRDRGRVQISLRSAHGPEMVLFFTREEMVEVRRGREER